MTFGGAGGFECPFCGSKAFMSDADFKQNEEFRKSLLQYYKAEAIKKDNDYSQDSIFTCRGHDSYTLETGEALFIDYMIKRAYDGYVCYLAKESVIYVFEEPAAAQTFMHGLRSLRFPDADTKLQRSVPELKLTLQLQSGAYVLVFVRHPNFYPAELFAPWVSDQLAWVISRMENICCLLQYSEIEHGCITPDAIWINPLTHEGALFGDWRKVRSLRGVNDLAALRRTAIALASDTRKPKELYDFLNHAPMPDAFRDFELWDKVIESGFGGHKFIKMDV